MYIHTRRVEQTLAAATATIYGVCVYVYVYIMYDVGDRIHTTWGVI